MVSWRRPDDLKFHMALGAPPPVAPFSHAVESAGFVFVTGQMPDTPDQPGQLPAGIEAQTRNVMANLVAVLDSLGLGLEQVVMARAYLTHFREDYAQFNATYRSYFPVERLPARTCVGVTGLAYDARVEIGWPAAGFVDTEIRCFHEVGGGRCNDGSSGVSSRSRRYG